MVAPTAKMSARASMSRPRACSGGMYGVVPRVVPSLVRRPSLKLTSCMRARPKSSTLRRPSVVTKRLAGLMSRWMMPCSCAAARQSSTCSAWLSTSATGSLPRRWMRSPSDSPESSSITRKGAPSSVMSMSRISTAAGWRKRLTACASRSKRRQTSLDLAASAWRILSASRRPIRWTPT